MTKQTGAITSEWKFRKTGVAIGGQARTDRLMLLSGNVKRPGALESTGPGWEKTAGWAGIRPR